ncbi:MAG: signal peptide peptidase SppA, partial [Desulfobacteraceae bacterium]
MAWKRSPILSVILILGVAAALLWGSIAALFLLSGKSTSLPSISLGRKIGVIPVEGVIEDSREILSQIVAFREDDSIRAIILRIDSPGGRVGPSQEIHREILKTNEAKRVVVSMGDVAASGGYYIACAAERIVANPGTIVGSIGVMMEFLQLQELLEKAGVGLEVLKSGEFKDVGSPHREMTPREREILMELIGDIQDQFVDAVARGRELSSDQVRKIADGRVFSGARAMDMGLVDQLGNFR